jgi:hypothetical protein
VEPSSVTLLAGFLPPDVCSAAVGIGGIGLLVVIVFALGIVGTAGIGCSGIGGVFNGSGFDVTLNLRYLDILFVRWTSFSEVSEIVDSDSGCIVCRTDLYREYLGGGVVDVSFSSDMTVKLSPKNIVQ